MAQFTAALADLAGSFISTLAPMTLGAFHTYSTNAGDATNGLYDPTAVSVTRHPSYAADAQLASVVGRWTPVLPARSGRSVPPFTRYFFPVEWTFQIYNSLPRPFR